MTELGTMVKILRISKGGMTQEALAADLDYSSSCLSTIFNGKAEPDMEFLIKCINYFELSKEDTIDFLFKAFSSCKRALIFEPSHFIGNRKELLIKAAVTLLLMPEFEIHDQTQERVKKSIEDLYTSLTSFSTLRKLTC
jgi:DNA-binding XRE family transcriptional regulator